MGGCQAKGETRIRASLLTFLDLYVFKTNRGEYEEKSGFSSPCILKFVHVQICQSNDFDVGVTTFVFKMRQEVIKSVFSLYLLLVSNRPDVLSGFVSRFERFILYDLILLSQTALCSLHSQILWFVVI